MGNCSCKKVLKILAGLALLGIVMKIFALDPWLVVGLYMVLAGLAHFVCNCEGSCCQAEAKGKKK